LEKKELMNFFFRNIARICFRIGDYCIRRIEGKKGEILKKWMNEKGDETMRLNYPSLCGDSFVMDLGGYKGQWTSDIYAKYNCTIWVFEPFKGFSSGIAERFSKNNKIRVFDFGLGNRSGKQPLYINNDSSSMYKQNNHSTPAEAKQEDINSFFLDNDIRSVDLIKINIEGGEYDVLDRLIDTGLVKIVKNIQVQFHDFVPGAKKRMKKIQEDLQHTHFPTYQYEFVWENWERR
jgi:FkbM family methyltransferase